jgi:hypothetical protein
MSSARTNQTPAFQKTIEVVDFYFVIFMRSHRGIEDPFLQFDVNSQLRYLRPQFSQRRDGGMLKGIESFLVANGIELSRVAKTDPPQTVRELRDPLAFGNLFLLGSFLSSVLKPSELTGDTSPMLLCFMEAAVGSNPSTRIFIPVRLRTVVMVNMPNPTLIRRSFHAL